MEALYACRMNRRRKFFLSLVVLSYLTSTTAALMRAREWAISLGAPALIMLGLAAMGHLITLDDDFPGGWSNPTNSLKFTFKSVGLLALETVAFALLFWLIVR